MSSDPATDAPRGIAVVMGVSGSGKTTIAERVAGALGWAFQEGDDLHPPANVEKMRQGIPLTDEDRWPWLAAVAAVIDGWRARGQSGVLTCSALKRAYRDVLVGPRQDVTLVYLHGTRALLSERIAARRGHFMPPSLLDSQFATLEEPGADERPIVVDVAGPIEATVAEVVAQLGRRSGTA